jgi:cbb3-type cytochrome c oxidase subunit III
MNKNKHLLLWSSAGVLALLVFAAVDENFMKDWRRIQKSAQTQEGPIDVRLRQIVSPGLGTSDRCVSCHVGMAPGEQAIFGAPVLSAHKPVVHQPSEFGCTTCHGGQGRATEKDDAHGDVHFWPQPMLEREHSYAGCGTCHTPLSVSNLDALRKGQRAFERLDCLACHRADGRGGTIRPGGGGMEGPDLSQVGFKGYKSDWYAGHLQRYEQAQSGPWKSSFGPIVEEDRASLEVFLSTRFGAPRLIEAKAQFNSAGCYGCHKVGGVGGDAGPELSRSGERDPGQLDFANVPGARTLANWVAQHFRSPASTVPGSLMPMLGLQEDQIDLLTMYVLSLRRREVPGSFLPRDRVQAARFGRREFTTDGATIFSAFCAGCHGAKGQGMRYAGLSPFPAIASPDFLSLASDEFIAETITRGRPGRQMLAWGEKEGGLRPDEIKAVVAYLREMGGNLRPAVDSSGPRWVKGDSTAGSRLYASYCSGCHGKSGQGAEGPALNNQVLLKTASDRFLVETISRGRRGTAMEGFTSPTPVRPALSQSEIESIVAYLRTWEAK